ncbi:putative F-box protein At1g47790 [Pyrus communis]|uniref:putative F-box protein At1g47790 n=1 Tax=Pyrus communis TaxID=23211 RepID=UPI0035C07CF4
MYSKCVAPQQVVLPFEIIIEILSLLTVESLLRFKCVCKQWRLLIQDYKFFVKHRDRTNYVLPLSYRYNQKSHKTVALSKEDFKLSCLCAGFYVELSVTSQVCRIRNPATRQVLYLPDAPKGTRTLDLAFNSLTGECKVASIYRRKAKKTGYLVGLEVITIGRDEKWRPLKYSSPNLLEYGQWLLQQSCCVKDKVEWIVHLPEIIKHGQDLCVQIQSLEPWSERITNTVLPRGVFSDLTKVSFFLWINCPAVVEVADEALNIMVLEDFKEHKWTPNITVPFNFLKDNRHLKDQIHFVKSCSADQLRFYAGGDQLYTYNLRRRSIEDTEYSQIAEEQLARHSSNLMTLKGMKPERSS